MYFVFTLFFVSHTSTIESLACLRRFFFFFTICIFLLTPYMLRPLCWFLFSSIWFFFFSSFFLPRFAIYLIACWLCVNFLITIFFFLSFFLCFACRNRRIVRARTHTHIHPHAHTLFFAFSEVFFFLLFSSFIGCVSVLFVSFVSLSRVLRRILREFLRRN